MLLHNITLPYVCHQILPPLCEGAGIRLVLCTYIYIYCYVSVSLFLRLLTLFNDSINFFLLWRTIYVALSRKPCYLIYTLLFYLFLAQR